MEPYNLREMLSKVEQEIYEVADRKAVSELDLAAAFLQVLRGYPDEVRGPALRLVTDIWDSIEEKKDSNGADFGLRVRVTDEMRSNLGRVVDAMLAELVDRKPSEAEFYDSMWSIVTNPFLRGEDAQAFALYNMLIDVRVPYFVLPAGITMSDSEFSERRKRLLPEIGRIRFAIRGPTKQLTEAGSIALDVILGVEDPADRAILMAFVIRTGGRGLGLEALGSLASLLSN